jgi:hypothetical protein
MPSRAWSAAAPLWVVVAGSLACGGSGAPGAGAPSEPIADAAHASDAPTGVRRRLQGTWEIVRYQSDHRIPDEAMPLVGDMFDSLRIRYDGGSQVVSAGKMPEERASFEVADESGSDFRLVVTGGMFDGGRCRFVSDDEWEVEDKGKLWPGVSRLRRTK